MPRQARAPASPRPWSWHLLLAAAGLVVWIVYLASNTKGVAWAAFIILIPVALLGFTMLLRWLAGRRQPVPASVGAAAASEAPAEQSFPVAIVVLHGLLAVTTVVLVLIAALQAT